MVILLQQLAETSGAQGGALGALGLDARAFLFQLITFVLVLLILRKYAFPPLVRTLEDRRKAVEKSIDHHKEAAQMVADAEAKAAKRADHIVTEARVGIQQELGHAREALKHETAVLVAEATGHIIKEKVDAKKNASLVSAALAAAAKEKR